MGETIKKYFKKEFQLDMFGLDHESASDFYLSSWQKNRSILPLLIIRTLVFIGSASVLIASMILSMEWFQFGSWFIFMTHWGLILITATSGLALAISLMAIFDRPKDASFGLPLYIKLYWFCYNATIPIAFFITLFYWVMLTDVEEDYAMDKVLDVFIHGINSVLMFILLVNSRHPSRLMHFYFPVCLGLVYMVFTIIFYVAGGLSPFGTVYIYPMLDWSNPGETTLVVFASAVLIIVIHWIIVAIAVGRDAIVNRYRSNMVLTISDDRYN